MQIHMALFCGLWQFWARPEMTYRRCYDDYVSRMPAEYQRPISEWTLDELRLRVVRHFLYSGETADALRRDMDFHDGRSALDAVGRVSAAPIRRLEDFYGDALPAVLDFVDIVRLLDAC